ncbi:MAG: hypothetical protein M1812_005864 [Candelaria pacifica]|nr:MAG: hypothetical protein M1812_005864 [Candelaria pacifica]
MADEIEFTQMWEEAFSIYQAETKRDLKNHPILRTLTTTDDLLKQIEERQQNFENFRKKKERLWRVLRRTMDQVVTLSGIAKNALQATPFAPASAGLGAVVFLVGAAKNVSSAYDCIIDLLSKLVDFTDRVQEYTKGRIDPKLRKKVTAFLSTLLEIFARSEELIKRDRWKQFFVVAFLGQDEKIAAAMGRLQGLVESEEKLVGALTYSTALKTDKNLDEVSNSLSESTKATREEAERNLIREALPTASSDKVQVLYGKISEERLSGTGEWVTHEPLFQAWMAQENPILWILGGPGAGKSFLSSMIISRLRDLYPQNSHNPAHVCVGYFYAQEDDQQLRSLNTMIKTIAYQIASNHSVYRKHLVGVCKRTEDISTATGSWKRMFTDFFGSPQYLGWSVYIVIDGLDEASRSERENLLKLLRHLEDSPREIRARVQITIIGRPELRDDINTIWEQDITFVEVSPRNNAKDISNYILRGIHRVKILKKRLHASKAGFSRIDLRNEIINKLTQGANGMFMWVKLMLDQISNKSRPSEVRTALNEAPQDLAKMIRHVFKRLHDDPSVGKEDLNEMLAWVACAQRPLVLGELDAILTLRSMVGEGMVDLEDRLRGQFASLFVLTRKDGKTTKELVRSAREELSLKQQTRSETNDDYGVGDEPDDSDEDLDLDEGFQSDPDTTMVQFSHASIRDYLISKRWPKDLGIGIDMNNAQYHITETCLSILDSVSHSNNHAAPDMSGYAKQYWGDHLLLIDKATLPKAERRAILRSLLKPFRDQSTIEKWYLSLSDGSFELFFKEPKIIQCVQDWFADDEALDTAASEKQLLEPMSKFCVTKWLTDKGGSLNHWREVSFLNFYHALDEEDYKDQDERLRGLVSTRVRDIPRARICQLAESRSQGEGDYWHINLARSLRDAGYVDAALQEFHMGLENYRRNSWVLSEVARCHEIRKENALAIQWMYKALAVLPEREPEKTQYHCLWFIANYSASLRDYENAVKVGKEAYSLSPEAPHAIYDHIWVLHISSHHEELLDFVEGLAGATTKTTQETELTEMLLGTDTPQVIGCFLFAARALGRRLDFVRPILQKAIAAAERREDPRRASELLHELGRFLVDHTDNKAEAIASFECVMDHIAERRYSLGSSMLWLWRLLPRSCSALSKLYLAEATAAEKLGSSPDAWIRKLESLFQMTKSLDDGVTDTSDASSALGCWYRSHGKLPEAKACFGYSIVQCTYILTDDEPENDMIGFFNLAQLLLSAGDEENAAAAFAVAVANNAMMRARKIDQLNEEQAKDFQQIEEQNIHLSEANEVEQSDTGAVEAFSIGDLAADSEADPKGLPSHNADLLSIESLSLNPDSQIGTEESGTVETAKYMYISCDAICERSEGDYTELNHCKVCLNTTFCDQCTRRVQSNNLPSTTCSSEHTFFQIFPTAERFEGVAAVKVHGKYEPRKEWLDMVKKKWGV